MRRISIIILGSLIAISAHSQDLNDKQVPPVVKAALNKKFPTASKVLWDREKGNYEANWGGRSGEDSSAQFTPAGVFVEWVRSVPISSLPSYIPSYVSVHYNDAKIKKVGRTTDVKGIHGYKVEILGKDLIFDVKGGFIREEE